MTRQNYEAIKSLYSNYRFGKIQLGRYLGDGQFKKYFVDWWDGRTSIVRSLKAAGITKTLAADILHKIATRRNIPANKDEVMNQAQRLSYLKMVNECKFDLNATSSRYNCTGIDWKAFHRPSSSGGWVLIAPDEPGNNWHTKDPIIVKYLTKKFLN